MSDYRQDLEATLQAARKRAKSGAEVRQLKAAAPSLFEIIDGEISLELNRGYSDTAPLSHDEYLESHGAVRGIRRIRNLLDSKEIEATAAAEQVTQIEKAIKDLKQNG